MVVPSKASSKAGLCEIEKVTLRAPGTGEVQPVATFEYQKRRYLWEAGTKKIKIKLSTRSAATFGKQAQGLGFRVEV